MLMKRMACEESVSQVKLDANDGHCQQNGYIGTLPGQNERERGGRGIHTYAFIDT